MSIDNLPKIGWEELAINPPDGQVNVVCFEEGQIFTEIFKRYQIPLPQVKKTLDSIVRSRSIVWEKRYRKIKADQLCLIDRIFKEKVYHGESALPRRTGSPHSSAEAGIDYLIGRKKRIEKVEAPAPKLYPRQAKLADYFESLFIEKRQSDLDECRLELEKAAIEAHDNKANEVLYRCFVYPLLTLLPFTNPPVGSTFQFDGTVYTVERRFDLETIGGSVQAYALRADDQPPLLLFKGSTFPGDDGFAATWLSDTTPGLSVGHIPARSSILKKWIENEKDVTVAGASLGGALALQMAALYGDHIGKVHAYNPAGLHLWVDWGKKRNMDVTIYSQWNDLVSTMGSFPPYAKIYRIVPMEPRNFVISHARLIAGEDEFTVYETSAEYENSRIERKVLIATHLLCSPIVFPLIAAPTLLYRIYELFSLSHLSKKSSTTSGDALIVITWIAVGALLAAFATFILTNRHLSNVKYVIGQIGEKRFEALAITIATLGSAMITGGLRATMRLHNQKHFNTLETSHRLNNRKDSLSDDFLEAVLDNENEQL